MALTATEYLLEPLILDPRIIAPLAAHALLFAVYLFTLCAYRFAWIERAFPLLPLAASADGLIRPWLPHLGSPARTISARA